MAGTHYELLGLRPDASQDEIRAAYRALARRHHPDTQHGADPATADRSRHTMAALNAAWAVLGDPVRRQAYDAALGRPGASVAGGAHARPMGASNRPSRDWQPFHEELDPEDLDDEPYGDPPPRRPSDSMVMTPVLLVAVAVALFFLSTMVGSPGLRTVSILLLPIAGVGFVAAPLFVMVRGRSRP
jgi:curved DNA-binding protein CbpA